jgi:biopolymer transport protein ExbD
MTPFMDLSVQLVIFFMLTSTFATSSALDVDLPSASTAAAVKEVEELKVTVDRQDNVSFDKRKVAFDELERIFRAGAAKSPKPEVMIGADRYASHGAVVRVMDTARKAGLDRFSIAAARDMDAGKADPAAAKPAVRRWKEACRSDRTRPRSPRRSPPPPRLLTRAGGRAQAARPSCAGSSSSRSGLTALDAVVAPASRPQCASVSQTRESTAGKPILAPDGEGDPPPGARRDAPRRPRPPVGSGRQVDLAAGAWTSGDGRRARCDP